MSIDVNVQNDLVIVTESSEDITVNVSNAAGAPGPAGANGVGVPVGGTTGQVLKKFTNTDYDTYWALDGGGVPYSGATGDVNLGEFQLRAGQVTLDTSPTGTAVVGTTRWNDTIGSSETTLKGGSVVLKNGVDLVARIVNKVTPNATLTKAAYQAVRVSGAQGQRLAVAFAQANNDANSADTIGLVCETIPTNQEGFIMTMGQLENINTTGSLQGETWADGDVLYLSPTTPGAITKVKPTGAGHIVVIGYVEYAHVNNGKIYVKVMNGWELEELHNVDIVTPANNEALIYESSTALWKNKTIATALGYTPISGSGVSGQVAYWNGTNSQTGSNNLFWDAANARLGIGTNAPQGPLHLVGARFTQTGSTSSAATTLYSLQDTNNSSNTSYILFGIDINGSTVGFAGQAGAYMSVGKNGTGTARPLIFHNFDTQPIIFANSNAERMRLFGATGNLVLQNGGTFTDGGQRLQVQGNTLLNGYTTINGDIEIDNVFRRIFAGASRNAVSRTSTGTSTIFYNAIQLASNNSAWSLLSDQTYTLTLGDISGLNVRNTFAPTSGTATFNHLVLDTRINQVGATGITRGLYVNPTLTAVADWRSIEWSNNTGWGLYGAGTAPNFLGGNLTVSRNQNAITSLTVSNTTAGNLSYTELVLQQDASAGTAAVGKTSSISNTVGIITPSNTYLANTTAGDIAIYNLFATGRIKFSAGSSTAQMTLTAAGRLLLGTTTEGTFLLDVNGTARVSGKLTANGSTTSTSGLDVGTLRFQHFATNNAFIAENTFYNGTAFERVNAGLASVFYLAGGGYQLGTLPNGAAGTTQSLLNNRMQIANDGKFVVSDLITGGGSITHIASAILQADSTTKGFLPPRMTTTQKNAIGTPAAGLQVYDTTLNQMSYYNGTTWVNF